MMMIHTGTSYYILHIIPYQYPFERWSLQFFLLSTDTHFVIFNESNQYSGVPVRVDSRNSPRAAGGSTTHQYHYNVNGSTSPSSTRPTSGTSNHRYMTLCMCMSWQVITSKWNGDGDDDGDDDDDDDDDDALVMLMLCVIEVLQ
jgi:hypothetical protein